MRTRLLAFVLLLSTFAAKAQYVTIPDANFAAWLNNNGFSQCMNGNQLDTTCPAVVSTVNLFYIDNSGPISNLFGLQYFDSLELFWWNSPDLANIGPLPNSLQNIILLGGVIDSLPDLPVSLTNLQVDIDSLRYLPALPSVLMHLIVSGCNFDGSNWPDLPDGLMSFDCSDNPVTTLPQLPASLTWLACRNTLINGLPDPLPPQLTNLDCSYSGNITQLPALPATLELLYTQHTAISMLPQLPNQIIDIYIGGPSLQVLPTLGEYSNLRHFRVEDVEFDSLPLLPLENLKEIYISRTGISYIPNLPDSMESLSVDTCRNLNCLPPFKHTAVFSFLGTPILCFSRPFTASSISQAIDTIPICGMFSQQECHVYQSIFGSAYFDVNDDCSFDVNELGKSGLKVSLLYNEQLIQTQFTDGEGAYYLIANSSGNYKVCIDTVELPFIVSCPVNGIIYDTLTTTDSIYANRNFALRCKTGFDLAAHSISTGQIFRPANNTEVNIQAGDLANFYNASCAHGVAGTVTVTINGPATYLAPASGATAPSNVSGNVITWNVADFGTANALTDFNIIVRADTFAQIGQQACFTVRVIPTVGDNDSSNNTLTYCFPIVNSYDPNDKTAYPSGDIDTAQEWLTYRVRFQNTGNAEAQHIYIMDTLDTNVDASTFQLLAYSHQPNVQIKENIVRFNFPNINLPDSFSNEPGSHGYVQYKVKLKENLPIGTNIENTAHISFDFNPPVVTNTTTNTIALVQDTTGVGIKQVNALSLNIYPNPANSQVTITTSQAGHTIYMYTAQGQLLSTQAMQGTAATINIEALPSGIYYIEVRHQGHRAQKTGEAIAHKMCIRVLKT